MSTVGIVFVTALCCLALGFALGYLYRGQQPTVAQAPAPELPTPVDLTPVTRELERLSNHINDIDEDRAVAYSAIASQVQAITRTSARLSDRTSQLITALRSPQVRGRWGEIQLERVVELGGMIEHCDFDVQTSARVRGQLYRPDMLVHLSGGRNVIVDAKVPFSSYLDALDTDDPEEKQGYLHRHAHLLRQHVDTLASKDYISAFQPTPEFVVLFVPADPFLDSALQQDPDLLDYAFSKDIVLATPTTLFALLRTVGLGWKNEDISERAKQVQRLGAELFTRLNTMADHYNRVGSSLNKAVEAFNSTLGSMDSRVMVTARKLADLDVPVRSGDKPVELSTVNSAPRKAVNDSNHFQHSDLQTDSQATYG
ncbi:DNA recombination protein RmuC [Corynebacterium breve]|uniref:DNA recombination protein RmuC n=1 Tax=Corynebacterium breve TaxID=3049799 RepID=A0ABY8VFV0_9CORY|nr:DNA recombination protein RmuC [Corynebacterium breve]WIM68520.1 DNA recombination protein RmuC [Corynebacterium breve]